jgi:hypothetical protein
MVLALCGGALRRYLARHGGIPKKPLIATMPISLKQQCGMASAATGSWAADSSLPCTR